MVHIWKRFPSYSVGLVLIALLAESIRSECVVPYTTCIDTASWSFCSGNNPPTLLIDTSADIYYYYVPDIVGACVRFDLSPVFAPSESTGVVGDVDVPYSRCAMDSTNRRIDCLHFDPVACATRRETYDPLTLECRMDGAPKGLPANLYTTTAVYNATQAAKRAETLPAMTCEQWASTGHSDPAPCYKNKCVLDLDSTTPYQPLWRQVKKDDCCTGNAECTAYGINLPCHRPAFCSLGAGTNALEGICASAPARDCSIERCARDELFCDVCATAPDVCSELDRHTSLMWQVLHDGSGSDPLTVANTVYPNCTINEASTNSAQACRECIDQRLNGAGFSAPTSARVCVTVGITCEAAKTECLAGRPEIEQTLCNSTCHVSETMCVASCSAVHHEADALWDCATACVASRVACLATCSIGSSACGSCYAAVETIESAYTQVGRPGASVLVEQYLTDVGMLSVGAHLTCRFAALLDTTSSSFRQCLEQAPCWGEQCEAETGRCLYPERDICGETADADRCRINTRCETTANSQYIERVVQPSAYGPVSAEIHTTYSKDGSSCFPCVFELPVTVADQVRFRTVVVHGVTAFSYSNVVPLWGVSTVIADLNISVPLGEFVLYDTSDTPVGHRRFGAVTIRAQQVLIVANNTGSITLQINGGIDVTLEEACDGADGVLGNDCTFTPACVDDGTRQCTSTDSVHVCQCEPSDGSCSCIPVDCIGDCDCGNCDDQNDCTIDSCDRTNGICTHAPVDCNSDPVDMCTLRLCRPTGGCYVQHTESCDDGNACTLDSCDPATGHCTHTDVNYTHGNALVDAVLLAQGVCAWPVCDPNTGDWVIATAPVDDSHVCTKDVCDPVTGVVSHVQRICTMEEAWPYSSETALNAARSTSSSCFIPICSEDAGGCAFTTIDCDDNNPCTDDSCDISAGRCVHTAADCGCDELEDGCVVCGCDANAGGCYQRPVVCNDGNLCTRDSCDSALGMCVHSNDLCGCSEDGFLLDSLTALPNLCQTCGCSVDGGGCWSRTVNCDDGDSTTTDTCVPTAGCQHTVAKCPVPTEGPCFEYRFNVQQGICNYTAVPKSCDDHNLCTTDVCVGGQCRHSLTCEPEVKNKCMIYGCEAATGECFAPAPKDCDDSNPCTVDSCDSITGACAHAAETCAGMAPSGDLCTAYQCSSDRGGCVAVPKVCEDGDACTSNVCDPLTGQCAFAPLHANCSSATDWCDPTKYACNALAFGCDSKTGKCTSWFPDFDDDDECTDDAISVDKITGAFTITHSPVACPWATDSCLQPIPCDAAVGCISRPIDCDDRNACTKDYCSEGVCIHTAVVCDDSDPCTVDACSDDAGGCLHTPVDCDDGNPATTDKCTASPAADGTHVCAHVSLDCDDADPCTVDSIDFVAGKCVHAIRPCVSPNLCVVGQCMSDQTAIDGWTCKYQRKQCEQPDDKCVSAACDPEVGICVTAAPKNCDDGNHCTVDYCLGGACFHNLTVCPHRNCYDGACYPGTGQCVWSARVCDDRNPSTVDSCNPETDTCQYARVKCPAPEDPCVIVSLDEVTGECLNHLKNCDDGNHCTADSCDGGACYHSAKACPHLECSLESCDPGTGQCLYATKDCDDHNPATVDECDSQTDSCIHYRPPCETEDRCEIATLDQATGECVIQMKNCDDSNPCTDDYCEEGECYHEEMQCENGDLCTIYKCDSNLGECVQVSVKSCEDGDACTTDSCDMFTGKCTHTLENCGALMLIDSQITTTRPDWMACESRFCDARDGACYAVPIDCSDGNACTSDSCVAGTGCIHVSKDCEAELVVSPARDGMSSLLANGTRDMCVMSKCSSADGRCYRERVECVPSDPRLSCGCDSATGRCVCHEVPCLNTDACLVATASPLDGHCILTPRDCRDDNPCTTDSCVRGECVHRPLDCDDSNPCTLSSCDTTTGECAHAPVVCTGTDKCMTYSCDPTAGCVAAPVVMEHDACTECTCNSATGSIVCAPISISDDNLCTFDSCVNGAVEHSLIDCSDGDPCTEDSCAITTGRCAHVLKQKTGAAQEKCMEYVCESCAVPADSAAAARSAEASECYGIDANTAEKGLGYRFIARVLMTTTEACAVSTCDNITGEWTRTPLADGTACDLDDPCYYGSCRTGACVSSGSMISSATAGCARSSSVPAAMTSTSMSSSSDEDDSTTTSPTTTAPLGLIIGLSVGSAALVALLAAGLCLCCLQTARRKDQDQDQDQDPQADQPKHDD